jgi:hypothetical protein
MQGGMNKSRYGIISHCENHIAIATHRPDIRRIPEKRVDAAAIAAQGC